MVESGCKSTCPRSELSVYLDGELSSAESLHLETHLTECKVCREELNLQKGLFRALEADAFFDGPIELPAGFSKTVAVHAESRVAGLRQRSERGVFLSILVGLVLLLLAAVGGDMLGAFAPASAAAERVIASFAALGHLLFNISLGAVVILRTLTDDSVVVSFISIAAIAISAAFLFARLQRYKRSTGSGG